MLFSTLSAAQLNEQSVFPFRALPSDLRWTEDLPEDLELVRRLIAELDLANQDHGYRTILDFVQHHSELMRTSDPVSQKPV